MREPRGQLEGITLLQMQMLITYRGERIGRQAPFRLLGDRVEGVLKTGAKIVCLLRQLEFRVGMVALALPPRGIIHEIRKGDVATTGGEKDVTGAQAIAHGDREPQFPRAPIERPIRLGQGGPKLPWDKGGGSQPGESLQRARIELTEKVQALQNLFTARFALERQGEERRQIPPEAGIAGA